MEYLCGFVLALWNTIGYLHVRVQLCIKFCFSVVLCTLAYEQLNVLPKFNILSPNITIEWLLTADARI
jgi:hypothetical protein